ncbi:hypothetical protein [Amycolatopsis panacis]|uniref:Uncharacterized protein n=1 Tax=Amycolatopsis panacis TaxID=2340917 RepID=A0A419I4A8_9PSEU|nr:hypothetical protein [Amycolatopsis panacis]RJQ85197.1 hypothetical protein D5S19_14425 [Amycolatopsis panacis]
MIELAGLLLVAQGGGGLMNRLAGLADPSWFVQLHLLAPLWDVVASVALLLSGVALLFAVRARKNRRAEPEIVTSGPHDAEVR